MSESSLEVHIETAHPAFDYNQMKIDHAKNKEKGTKLKIHSHPDA